LVVFLSCTDEELTLPESKQKITLDPEPDFLNAPWELSGPAGFLTTGRGDRTLTDLETGDYTLTWGATVPEFPDYLPPNPSAIDTTLRPNEEIRLTGLYTESIPIEEPPLVLLEEGEFLMGSSSSELGSSEEERPQHQVLITAEFGRVQPFAIATTEVTQRLWRSVMGNNPSWFTGCDSCPVERVNWQEAIDFCNRLSDAVDLNRAYQISGDNVTWDREANGYRLPTEAEWEYACRAANQTAFTNGDISGTACDQDANLDLMGWYCGNSNGQTVPVAQKAPNDWVLFDMHGNVWEWVWDWYGEYSPGTATNPTGPASGNFRVLRGGSWLYGAQRCRSAYRQRASPKSKASDVGFRLARFVDPPKADWQEEREGP
jgi:formylglycine-generating enzyme required for sulfatase activity